MLPKINTLVSRTVEFYVMGITSKPQRNQIGDCPILIVETFVIREAVKTATQMGISPRPKEPPIVENHHSK